MEGLIRLYNQGIDLNKGDYDQRTPVHLAAADGNIDVLKFLIETVNVDFNPRDRWGSTPLNDAKLPEVREYLESIGAERGKD